VPLRHSMTHHEIVTACERGWARLTNGDLLDVAETDSFEVLVTTDTNLRYQQNLGSRRIAVVVLSSPSWPRIQRAIGSSVRASIERPWAATPRWRFHHPDGCGPIITLIRRSTRTPTGGPSAEPVRPVKERLRNG